MKWKLIKTNPTYLKMWNSLFYGLFLSGYFLICLFGGIFILYIFSLLVCLFLCLFVYFEKKERERTCQWVLEDFRGVERGEKYDETISYQRFLIKPLKWNNLIALIHGSV